MSSILECRLFKRTFAIDDISKRAQARNLKFKRAFQFLQLLLIQRVYSHNAIAHSTSRRISRQQQQTNEKEQENDYEVFLGGSCNPTTWRHDLAIPYFKYRSVSYYNPQVADWSPDLIEIEHRAKESAPLLFFVIDPDTRALASMIEVCYLAARGRYIIVVMSPMPEKNSTKFIQNKSQRNETDDEADYDNTCEARRISQQLLRSLDIPVFETIDSALECAAYILETTKRSVTDPYFTFQEMNEGQDLVAPLLNTPDDSDPNQMSKIVFIRSISKKTCFNNPDEFYRQIRKSNLQTNLQLSEESVTSSVKTEHHCSTYQDSKQTSCSPLENDDDGYGSLSSTNRTLSVSASSLVSESFEATNDHSTEETNTKSSFKNVNGWMSRYDFYANLVAKVSPILKNSIFAFVKLPFRILRYTILLPQLPFPTNRLPLESTDNRSSDKISSDIYFQQSNSTNIFDIYIAAGESDQVWLNTVVLPTLKTNNISYVQRQSNDDSDQPDIAYEMHIRSQSRLIFYVINGMERLSHLTAELAFLIGERKKKIVVFMESNIEKQSNTILSPCEQKDLERSRKYLQDILEKEKITRIDSREQICPELFSQLLSQ